MASRDLHNNLKLNPSHNPQAAITGNATTNGAIIDTQGFESVEFSIQSGVITDGTFTPNVQEGDAANLSDAATVAAGDLLGTLAAATFVATTDNNKTKKIGYKGIKRYVRLQLIGSGQTTGGFIASTAVQGHGRNAVLGPAPAP
jgi:hypothetical protein